MFSLYLSPLSISLRLSLPISLSLTLVKVFYIRYTSKYLYLSTRTNSSSIPKRPTRKFSMQRGFFYTRYLSHTLSYIMATLYISHSSHKLILYNIYISLSLSPHHSLELPLHSRAHYTIPISLSLSRKLTNLIY